MDCFKQHAIFVAAIEFFDYNSLTINDESGWQIAKGTIPGDEFFCTEENGVGDSGHADFLRNIVRIGNNRNTENLNR